MHQRIQRRPTADPAITDAVATMAPAGPAGLTVGAVDDPAERDADRMADLVVRALATAPPTTPTTAGASSRVQRSTAVAGAAGTAPASTTRVRRSATVGAAGGVLDPAASDTIERARGGGAPLGGDVRRRMEHGFGADLGAVRLHSGPTATALNDSMGAAAFTVGNDIFLHGSSPSAAAPDGERLLAHEIAHTLQDSGSGHRLQRKMMSTAAFNAATDEGILTASSKAQKAIRVMLESYHATYPWEKQLAMTPTQANAAIEKLEEIRQTAQMWIKDHEVMVNGTVKADPKRVKRRAGMDALIQACEGEMLTMRDLAQYQSSGDVSGADHNLGGITISQESEAYSKVKQQYTGDAVSCFRKLGFLIDGAVPMVGDKSSITIEVTIPVATGAFIGLEFEAEAERDGPPPKAGVTTPPPSHVEAGITVGVTGGGNVGSIAKLSAGIGCFLTAKAKTGADVAELMSYALYRRCQESPLVPRELSSAMWGGGRSDDYGWVKAEEWSKGVENRIFAGDDEAEVTSGGYGKLAAEVELSKDLASLGLEIKGTAGTKINKESIEKAKGAVGAKNKTSSGADIADGGGTRGTTQKSLGVTTLGLETSASFTFGILSGGIGAEFGWTKSGVGPTGAPAYVFDTFEISAELAGELPMNKMAGNAIAALIPNLVGSINKVIRGSTTAAQAETKAKTGGAIAEDVGSYAAIIAELASVPAESWDPFAANPAEAGLEIGSTAKIELHGSFDFKAGELSVELRLGKSSALAKAVGAAGDVTQVFKVDISKSSRLLRLTHDSGGWALS